MKVWNSLTQNNKGATHWHDNYFRGEEGGQTSTAWWKIQKY